jgi:hypothetical protein
MRGKVSPKESVKMMFFPDEIARATSESGISKYTGTLLSLTATVVGLTVNLIHAVGVLMGARTGAGITGHAIIRASAKR